MTSKGVSGRGGLLLCYGSDILILEHIETPRYCPAFGETLISEQNWCFPDAAHPSVKIHILLQSKGVIFCKLISGVADSSSDSWGGVVVFSQYPLIPLH